MNSIKRVYIFLSAICFSTVLLIIGLNIVGALIKKLPPEQIYSSQFISASYTFSSKEEAIELGKEFDLLGDQESFSFYPWTVFRNTAFKGRYLNVNEDLTRRTEFGPTQKVAPDEIVIWMFGGSTLFGWGVADQHTIPSQLQKIINQKIEGSTVRVINYGTPYFYSSTELALYTALLRDSKKPNLVIFFDGVNDSAYLLKGYDQPWFSPIARHGWEQEQYRRFGSGTSIEAGEILFRLPMMNLVRLLQRKLYPNRSYAQQFEPPPEKPEHLENGVRRYKLNIEAQRRISESQGISSLHILQPAIFWNPNAKNINQGGLKNEFYKMLMIDGPDYLIKMPGDLIGQDLAYVDEGHYSEGSCLLIAEKIFQVAESALHAIVKQAKSKN